MIVRTSFGEIGHCDICGSDCNSHDLWEREIEFCRECDEPLYVNGNIEHYIPEMIDGAEPKFHTRTYGKYVFTIDEPKSAADIGCAVKSEFNAIDSTRHSVVNRPGYYAFDDYDYPFHIRGVVRIDSDKALIAVNPRQGYFLFREQYEKGISPERQLKQLDMAIKTSFGEPSDWLNVQRYSSEDLMPIIKCEKMFSLADVLMVSNDFYSKGFSLLTKNHNSILCFKLADENVSVGWVAFRHPTLYVYSQEFYETPKDGYYVLPFSNNDGKIRYIVSFDKPKIK